MWSRAALALAVLLGGCSVAPLYGTDGFGAGTALGRVAVDPASTRVAQQVRERLIRDLGRPDPGAATLTLNVTNSVETFLTDFETDRASAGTVTVTVAYQLIAADGATVTSGRERARASFDAPLQEFAKQRAIRDAEDRAAREAAARVRLAIAPAVAGLPSPGGVAPVFDTAPERDPEGI